MSKKTDKTVTCHAEKIPNVVNDPKSYNPFLNYKTWKTFSTTLTVPDAALYEYARTWPWNGFGTIMGFSGKTVEPDFTGGKAVGGDHDTHEVARYAADGRRMTTSQKGVNIVRLSDGTVRKVMK